MTAVATDAGRAPSGDLLAERPAIRLFEPAGPSLEEAIVGVWAELVADGRAECPVCGGTMRAAGGCDGCGADLS